MSKHRTGSMSSPPFSLSASPPLCPNHYIWPINKCQSCHTGKWSHQHGNWWQAAERMEASQKNSNKPNMCRRRGRRHDGTAGKVRQLDTLADRQVGRPADGNISDPSNISLLNKKGKGSAKEPERPSPWRRRAEATSDRSRRRNVSQSIVDIIKFKCCDLNKCDILCWQMFVESLNCR